MCPPNSHRASPCTYFPVRTFALVYNGDQSGKVFALAALEASGLECEAPGDLHRQKWSSSYSGHAQVLGGSPHM